MQCPLRACLLLAAALGRVRASCPLVADSTVLATSLRYDRVHNVIVYLLSCQRDRLVPFVF